MSPPKVGAPFENTERHNNHSVSAKKKYAHPPIGRPQENYPNFPVKKFKKSA